MRRIWNRVYSDYLMPPRLNEWKSLLELALSAGYRTASLRDYWEKARPPRSHDIAKLLLVRHDVDTDPTRARSMFAVEQDLGVKSSYYFRLSTADIALMREIEASGSEASYHFEEIATLAKRRALCSRAQIEPYMPEIRELFRNNLFALRQRTGNPLKSIAAHGDFVNRHVNMANQELLTDALREQTGIAFETYDTQAMAGVSSRFCDGSHPWHWRTSGIQEAIARGDRVIYLLAHSRHWGRSPAVNSTDNARRAWEGLRYWWHCQRRPPSTAAHANEKS